MPVRIEDIGDRLSEYMKEVTKDTLKGKRRALTIDEANAVIEFDRWLTERFFVRPKGPKCDAVLHHGPGHQSTTKCERVGKHEVHMCLYGRYERVALWTGDEACTGFFDEPPRLEDDDD